MTRIMFNAQLPVLNEWTITQCGNVLAHLIIDHSLNIEHCQLNIASVGDTS